MFHNEMLLYFSNQKDAAPGIQLSFSGNEYKNYLLALDVNLHVSCYKDMSA